MCGFKKLGSLLYLRRRNMYVGTKLNLQFMVILLHSLIKQSVWRGAFKESRCSEIACIIGSYIFSISLLFDVYFSFFMKSNTINTRYRNETTCINFNLHICTYYKEHISPINSIYFIFLNIPISFISLLIYVSVYFKITNGKLCFSTTHIMPTTYIAPSPELSRLCALVQNEKNKKYTSTNIFI